MAFPTTQLPVSVWIAPGGDPADPSGWPWVEITNDVRVESGIEITQGRQDEGNRTDPTQIRMTIDNRTGNYTTRNPLGRWYGQLGKSTPLQVRYTRILDTFTRTVASGLGTEPDSGLVWSAGSEWSVNGTAAQCALSSASASPAIPINGTASDVDITYVASVNAAGSTAAWVSAVMVRYASISNHYRLHTEFSAAGTIQCKIAKVVGGVLTDLTAVVSTGVSFTSGTRIRTRAQAFGDILRIKAWLDGSTEPTAWTVSTEDNTFPDRSALGLYQWRLTSAGPSISTIDDFRADAILATAFVSEWPARWDQSAHDSTTPIVGSGILRRLRQGAAAFKSPIRTYLTGQTPGAYWPCEDGSDSQTIGSALAGGVPATVSGVTFASDSDLDGSDPVVSLDDFTSQIQGTVARASAGTTGYGALFFCRFPSLPAGDVTVCEFTATGTIVKWRIIANTTTMRIEGYNSAGATSVAPAPFAWGGQDPTTWTAYYLTTSEVAGTVTYALKSVTVGVPLIWTNSSGTYAGTAIGQRLTGFRATGQTAAAYGHFWLGHNTLPFNTWDFIRAATGYAGELAHDRLTRLCGVQGIPVATYGKAVANTDLTSSAMGIQRSGTFVAQLEEIEDAEQGLLFERGAGLAMRVRRGRYNAVTIAALDFNSGHVAEPPEPSDDDQRLRNQIVLTRTGGSSVTVQDDASIALDGLVSDELTVNLELDANLTDHASWRLADGTISDLRWPVITLDLASRPALIFQRCNLQPSYRASLANPPSSQLLGVSIDLVIEGWTDRMTPFGWDVTLICSPAKPWSQVGVYDQSTSRYDSGSTTLVAAQTSSSTSWGITTVDRQDVWSTTSLPYSWSVGGETVTVTAMTASSGSGPYTQTATVTRAVNGIVKAQTAGSEIHLASPVRYGL
jgi:hypothetical protein